MNESCIAERHMLYSAKGCSERKELIIRIGFPVKMDRGYACPSQWVGLFDIPMDKYGIDPIHAIYLASNIDPFLKDLAKKYDFFWLDGEPYFDDEDDA